MSRAIQKGSVVSLETALPAKASKPAVCGQPRKGPEEDAMRPQPRRDVRSKNPSRNARADRLKGLSDVAVRTGKLAVAEQMFDELVVAYYSKVEGNLMVVYGSSGSGKTHVLRQLRKDEDLQLDETDPECARRPLLMIEAPSPCTLKTLGLAVLQGLGYEEAGFANLREHEVWRRARANLSNQGTGILVIDEMHNVLAGRSNMESVKIAMTLKSLMVSEVTPIQIVISGLKTVRDFAEHFKELQRRSQFLEMTPLTSPRDDKKLVLFLEGLEKELKFRTCGFTRHDLPVRFMMASRGLIGRVAYFVKMAAKLAITLGDDEIKQEYLGKVYERIYRVSANQNPFLMANVASFVMPREKEADELTFVRGVKEVSRRNGDAAD
ncbi:hypothetical protein RPD_0026 [Rhodopseudomonas palustris BisB5]|uniref:ORC1/DEAH AAA+ ATPase domain-containing protein n=1 Tax=Rhodopseudomonas palustris (strain BisB5) TaxID=316057 RepID=Q13F73_RHOPS|nr:hypothetical protein RPD_0026 [Rhodopseudomonas palustris BisB5]